MSRKTLLTLSVHVMLATISLAPTAVFAQFPPPPPIGPGGVAHVGFGGPAPRLGAGAGPRGDLGALGGVRAGPAVARSIKVRSALVSDSSSGSFSHGHGGRRYGYGAAYVAGAYAGYAYGSSNDGSYSTNDCYYAYSRHRRLLVCN
jgi:hypothetical protein